MRHLLMPREENGQSIVSARDLYEFLEVKTDFSDWCKRMYGYGFIENIDYSLLKIGERDFTSNLGKSHLGRPTIDYALTLDCAKEISMLQRTEKGKEARLYFIECERRIRVSPQQILETIASLKIRLDQAEATIKELTPKAMIAENFLNIVHNVPSMIVAKTLGMNARGLHKFLLEQDIAFRFKPRFMDKKVWLIKSPYERQGYCIQKIKYEKGWGKWWGKDVICGVSTYWTPKGILFLNDLVNQTQLMMA